MITVFGGITVLFSLAGIVGLVLALRDRGRKTTRQGPEVYQELVESRYQRDDRHNSGRSRRWVKTKGTGYGVNVEASYDWPEMITAWRERRWRFLLPPLLGGSAIVGIPMFAGLTLTQLSDSGANVFGWLLAGFAMFMAFKMTRIVRRSIANHDDLSSAD